jgi:pantoate--beta-alanine ligase
MIIAKTVPELRLAIKQSTFRSLGFVPTMGALHEGHISLIQHAAQENDLVVVSIFINPKQFGPHEDYYKYPRDLDNDLEILKNSGAHILFLPEDDVIYQSGDEVEIRLPQISSILCGKFRPGHFDGVALVLTKLFNIVAPNKAYFGQKDYQQTILIKKMVDYLFWNLEIIVCPTIRDEDGLAKSSRNRYLSNEDRKSALSLYTALCLAREKSKTCKDVEQLVREAKAYIASVPNVVLEYFEIRRAKDLKSINFLKEEAVALGAVYVNGTRLIDNILLTES